MIEIKLPEEVRALVEGSIFDLEDSINDDRLAKFLFYCPELVRTYGLAMAELRRLKRNKQKEIIRLQGALEVYTGELLLDLDTTIYRNEALREARINTDPGVEEKKGLIKALEFEILDIDSDLDELNEYYWSYRSLRDSLSDISKGRTAEKRL